MAIATSARNSRAGSTPRTTTTGTNARTNSVAQTSSANSARSQNKKVNSFDRNVVIVDPQTGKQRLERNRVVRQNRGQVYQNGRLVADYGVGEGAARKAQGFAASIGTSPYSRGQTTVTIGKQESAYAPPSRTVNGREVQTGGPSSRVLPPEGTQRIEPRSISQRPAPMFSRLAPVARDQAAEDAARARIAQERGIDVNTASGATISLLDEAVNQDVYGQARPTFGQGALTPTQKAQEQSIAASVRAEPVTPQEVQSIITSEQAKTFRDSEIQDLQEWQAESFGTVSDGFNDLLTSDADIIGAIQGGEDAQGLLEQRRMFYEEQYNSLKSEISRIYSEKASDYKTQAAQQMGSTISQLAAMGALGTTTAGIQYVNDVQRVNSAKLLSFAAEEAAALESAYSAFQEADFKTAQEMIDNAKATREEIRKVKQEQLANKKTMLELKKLEREDASQTIDAMVSSGLDISNLPDGYLEYLDAKGGYAPGTSAGLWNVAQKERAIADAKTAQEAESLAIENARNMATFLEGTATGGTVSIGGTDYQILAKGDVITGSEIDASGNVTVWSLDKGTGEVKTHRLGNIGSPAGWEPMERNGVMGLFNSTTGDFKVIGDTGAPNLGYASGGIMDILPQGSINYSGRHQNEGSTARNIWMDAQCGSFVNDMTGIGVGDTWESKQAKMTNDISGLGAQERLSRVPSVGDVFVQKIGSNNLGHVGIVNSVIPIYDDAGNIVDYQLSLTESNWKTTKDPATLQTYGIDPSVLNDSTVAQRGIGLVTHDRTMKLSDPKLTGFASPGFKDPAYNFGGTDAGTATDRFFAPTEDVIDEPKVVTINGKPMVWDTASGRYIDAPTDVQPTDTNQVYTDKIANIDTLISHSGLNNAVGPNRLSRGYGVDYLTGAPQDFIGSVQQLVQELTLDRLIDSKAQGATFGALSEGELRLLAGSASKIGNWEVKDENGNVVGYNTSEKAFRRELENIKKFFAKLGGSTQIRVRVKATGETGMLPEGEFDPNVYERI